LISYCRRSWILLVLQATHELFSTAKSGGTAAIHVGARSVVLRRAARNPPDGEGDRLPTMVIN
jgi:hypothetical protein